MLKVDTEGAILKIEHPTLSDHYFMCTSSATKRWEHVTVIVRTKETRSNRCPSWEEMCFVKDQFWDEETAVMQLHPPKSNWISNHPYALHLWRPVCAEIPLPPRNMVGVKKLVFEKVLPPEMMAWME